MKAPRAARKLACIRIALGVMLLVRTTPLLSLLPRWAHDAAWLGWPDGRWTTTLAPALPAPVVRGLVVARTLGAVALLFGVRARWLGLAGACAGLVVLTQDAFAATHTIRLMMVACALVSIDGGTTRALVADRPFAPAASAWLLRALVVSVYAWSALAKLDADWLSGRTLSAFHDDGLIAGWGSDAVLATAGRCRACALVVAGFDASIGPLLIFARTRRFALVAAVLFHVALEVVVRPDLFGFVMIALLVAFTADE